MSEYTANLLGVVALAAADRMEETAREILDHSGETPAALVVIGYGFGPSNNQLRRILGLSHPGAVRLVDRLVADKLAERRPGKDKRAVALFLTDKGQRLRSKLLKGRIGALMPFLSNLSAHDRDALTGILHRMLTSLDPNDMERCHLCRLCDDSVCIDCPIPADFRDGEVSPVSS